MITKLMKHFRYVWIRYNYWVHIDYWITQIEYSIFLLEELWLWLKWRLHLFSDSQSFHHQRKHCFFLHFWGRKLEVYCWVPPVFWFFPPRHAFFVFTLRAPFHQAQCCSHYGISYLSHRISTVCSVSIVCIFCLITPSQGPIGLTTRTVVNLDAGHVRLADIVLSSLWGHFKLKSKWM